MLESGSDSNYDSDDEAAPGSSDDEGAVDTNTTAGASAVSSAAPEIEELDPLIATQRLVEDAISGSDSSNDEELDEERGEGFAPESSSFFPTSSSSYSNVSSPCVVSSLPLPQPSAYLLTNGPNGFVPQSGTRKRKSRELFGADDVGDKSGSKPQERS